VEKRKKGDVSLKAATERRARANAQYRRCVIFDVSLLRTEARSRWELWMITRVPGVEASGHTPRMVKARCLCSRWIRDPDKERADPMSQFAPDSIIVVLLQSCITFTEFEDLEAYRTCIKDMAVSLAIAKGIPRCVETKFCWIFSSIFVQSGILH
jgi:hypothetical protein